MRRSLIALAVVAVLVMAAGVPASAQTWIQLRGWWPNFTVVSGSSTSHPMDTSPYGFSLRRTLMGGEWAASFNFDSGQARGLENGSTNMFNRFWNFNLHRNFTSGNTAFSLFAGWGSVALEETLSGFYVRQSGFRLGADGRISLPQQWYLKGSLAYGPFGQGTTNPEGVITFNARVTDWQVGVGRSFGVWGLEAGYRSLTWDFDPAVTCGTGPCQYRWPGLYVGLNLTMP